MPRMRCSRSQVGCELLRALSPMTMIAFSAYFSAKLHTTHVPSFNCDYTAYSTILIHLARSITVWPLARPASLPRWGTGRWYSNLQSRAGPRFPGASIIRAAAISASYEEGLGWMTGFEFHLTHQHINKINNLA